MSRIEEALYRVFDINKTVLTEARRKNFVLWCYGHDDTILKYDDQIDFKRYVALKYLDLFKGLPNDTELAYNSLPFYFDDYTLVDKTHGNSSAESLFLCKKYSYKDALDRIEELLDLDTQMHDIANDKRKEYQLEIEAKELASKEKEEAENFPELAKTLKMQYHDKEANGFRSLFSRDKLSYGNGFKYNDIFKKDNSLKKMAENPIVRAVWRYVDDPNLLLVATPGFNFLTTYDMFIEDINNLK